MAALRQVTHYEGWFFTDMTHLAFM